MTKRKAEEKDKDDEDLDTTERTAESYLEYVCISLSYGVI